jgi:co-chaperonin GroES (HSP10)
MNQLAEQQKYLEEKDEQEKKSEQERLAKRDAVVDTFLALHPYGILIDRVGYTGEDKTESGLVLPKEYQKQKALSSTSGIVLKIPEWVGEDIECEQKKAILEVGMKIIFSMDQPIPAGLGEDYPELQVIHVKDIVGAIK